MKNSLVDGDGFNLYQGVLGQGGYLERSTGGAIGRKVLCIHFVHGTKVGNIAQQNSGFDYITQAQTAGFQYCLDILQRLFGLHLDGVAGKSAGGGVNGQLAGNKGNGTGAGDGLAVRANGAGALAEFKTVLDIENILS